jgi:hypothetical protein
MRMAIRADVHANAGLRRASGCFAVARQTNYGRILIIGMNLGFHGVFNLPYKSRQISAVLLKISKARPVYKLRMQNAKP